MTTNLKFTRSLLDTSVFFRKVKDEHTIVAVSTDDMAFTSTTSNGIKTFKDEIREHWEFTDHGEIKWLLGFQVRRDREAGTVAINQESFIDGMLGRFHITDIKPASTPMDPNIQLTTDQCPRTEKEYERMQNVPYQRGCGELLWISRNSRPDISFAVQQLTQFMQNPGLAHWEAMKRCMAYLKATKTLWLYIGGGPPILLIYTDASWASSRNRHSITGFIVKYGEGVIAWCSRKQPIVTLSSTESEYVAITDSTKEALFFRMFIAEINYESLETVETLSDSTGAMAIAKHDKFHQRTKHIDVRYHFIREAVEDAKIKLTYISTKDNIADMFTKPLARPEFQRFASMLGLHAA